MASQDRSDMPNNPKNFEDSVHGGVVLQTLKVQKEEGRFCDVTLYVDGKQIEAHRSVLAACSPYFDSVFKMHKTVKEKLSVTCQNSDIFNTLLNYMYTGSVTIDRSNVTELLRLSNHFLVAKLKDYCAEYLDRYLDITNCLSVREMAEKYNLQGLLKASTLFVQVHMHKIVNQDELLKYPLNKLEAFLSEKAWSVPHNIMLTLFARWVHQDTSSRERSMKRLLTYIDWRMLDSTAITEHIDREPLYQTSEMSLFFVLQSLVDNSLLFPKYQGMYQNLHNKFMQSGFLMDESFFNAAVSTAIDGLNNPNSSQTEDQTQVKEKSLCSNLSGKTNDGKSDDVHAELTSVVVKKALKKKKKIILSCLRRRREKLLRLRPGARLAALKAALKSKYKMPTDGKYKKMLKVKGKGIVYNKADSKKIIKGYRCHVCHHVASDTIKLERHLAETHSLDVTYKCGVCGFMCQWNNDYYTHMKEHFSGPPFKCDTCDFSCDRISQVLTHRLKHSDERPHRCDQCGYTCKTKTNLLIHLRCHSGDRPYKCEVCGRAFMMKQSLEQHLATHGTDKPYICDLCGFSTKYLSHLIAHKRIHSGDLYRCSYPQCKYSTPKKSQLGTHARTHAGVRPHSCTICGRGFLEKSHLVRHERIHLDEKPFKCSQCEYASSRRDKLKEHFGRHHGENASAKVPYKARPIRSSGSSSSSSTSSVRSSHKTCHGTGSDFGSPNNLTPAERSEQSHHQPSSTELNLMIQQHSAAAPSSNVSTNAVQHSQAPYPTFTNVHHPSLDYHHHHQLANSRQPSKSDHHPLVHQQPPHHMLPRTQHPVQTSAVAVAAMMLDPRFPASSYHPAPVTMNQTQNVGVQHHQGEYPCMPLF